MARGKHRPDVVTWNDVNSDGGFPSTAGQRFLAEGDSWFSLSGLPAFNLLFALRFHEITDIVTCAFPGDTIRHMSEIAGNRQFREALTTPGFKWKGIFLSGGGNDLIDKADQILIPKPQRRPAPAGPEDYCDQTELRALILEVQSGFRRLASIRDAANSNSRKAPIIAHTYDYAMPRAAPARFFLLRLGPWLHPSLKAAEVPEGDWMPISRYLTDTLAEGIQALGKGGRRIKNFHVVDGRGATRRASRQATGSSNDWQNEIHPNDDGYRKIAKRMEKKLDELFG